MITISALKTLGVINYRDFNSDEARKCMNICPGPQGDSRID